MSGGAAHRWFRRLWFHADPAFSRAGRWLLACSGLGLVAVAMIFMGLHSLRTGEPPANLPPFLLIILAGSAFAPLLWLRHMRRARRMAESRAPSRGTAAPALSTIEVMSWTIRNGDGAIRLAYAMAGLMILATAELAWTLTGAPQQMTATSSLPGLLGVILMISTCLLRTGHMGRIRIRRFIGAPLWKTIALKFLLALATAMLVFFLLTELQTGLSSTTSPVASYGLRAQETLLLLVLLLICLMVAALQALDAYARRRNLLARVQGGLRWL